MFTKGSHRGVCIVHNPILKSRKNNTSIALSLSNGERPSFQITERHGGTESEHCQANLKKCHFHQDEVRFLGYVVSAEGVRMEDERIEVVRTWPEPQSVRDIQVFIGFANFYRRFIQGFSRIAAPLTSLLKTAPDSTTSAPTARK